MSAWGRVRRLSAIVLTVTMVITLLAACGGNNDNNTSGEERVLRIGVTAGYNAEWGDYIRQQFTEIFEWVNPNIKIEFIENSGNNYYYNPRPVDQQEEQQTPMDILKDELDGANPPDVILMEYEHMAELVRENYLISLEPLMQDSQMDVDEFVPSVIDALKAQSEDGKLYALAPMFSSSVLAYNKKLFTDQGVAFPTDGMTWDEAFNLARQVTHGVGNDRVYGFAFSNYRYNDIFYDTGVYTSPLGLRYWDDQGEKMMVNTPEWIKAWKTLYELKKDSILPEPPDWSQPQPEQGPFDYNSLLSGKVAMSIINYWDLSEIINVNRNAANIENFEPIDWDIVSVPTHPEAPGVGGYVYLNGIMGISANAQNQEDAWKFIEFIMSERWAQQKSKNVQQMVTWKKYNEPRAGLDYNLEAFYYNIPARDINNYGDIYIQKPDIWQAQNIGYTKFQEVLNGNKTVEEALQEWETEGDAILQQMKENNGRIDPNFGEPGLFYDERQAIMEAAGEIPFTEEFSTDGVETEAFIDDLQMEEEVLE